MTDVETHEDQERTSGAYITVIVQNRYAVNEGPRTGREIKQLAGVPPAFSLYRRAPGGNQRVGDDEVVAVRRGDHFFARPSR